MQGALRSFYLLIQSREDQHVTHSRLCQCQWLQWNHPERSRYPPWDTRPLPSGAGRRTLPSRRIHLPQSEHTQTREITPRVWVILSPMIRSLTGVTSVIIGTSRSATATICTNYTQLYGHHLYRCLLLVISNRQRRFIFIFRQHSSLGYFTNARCISFSTSRL